MPRCMAPMGFGSWGNVQPPILACQYGPQGFRPLGYFFDRGSSLDTGKTEKKKKKTEKKKKVDVFIDGFNLYHAIDNLNKPHLKWVDLWKLSECFISKKTHKIGRVFYFTSMARWKPCSHKRQEAFLDAIHSKGVEVWYGRFQRKPLQCDKCKYKWFTWTEKQTDVNIASFLVGRAALNKFDSAIFISQDSDFVVAIRTMGHFKKPIKIVTPPRRKHSTELVNAASGNKGKIIIPQLENCQLETVVKDSDGNTIAVRPPEYMPP